jgi:CubicO group peptidase (beta-lactamase class C family)
LPDWADRVRLRHLLTYTSGLPHIDEDSVSSDADILADLHSLPALGFEPGTGYLYSNNNVFLRERIIESVLEMPYGRFVHARLFEPCGMAGAIVDPPPGAVPIAKGFDNAGVEDDGAIPWSGTPFVTASDLYRWSKCLHTGELLTASSLLELTASFEGGKSALGMSGVEDGVMRWHGHVGSSYNSEAGYYANLADDLTVVILTNNKNFRVGSLAMAAEAALKGAPAEVPKRSLYLALRTTIYHEGFDAGLALYEDIRSNQSGMYDLSDEMDDLDDTGHFLLRKSRFTDAVRVFEWIVSLYPQRASAHTSLGNAYLAMDDVARATASYRRALDLDPTNTDAQNLLDRLGS